ncbi:MAG: ribonuclease J [Alphaproteobacteria bacterium]
MSKNYFLPLGGTGEIGMNLNLYGYSQESKEEWIMIDCGVTFSQSGAPGIDLQMADPNFIAKKKKNLLGIILTHAHEDHIGAMPFIWPHLQCPIYTTKFTASLLEEKFNEYKISFDEKLVIIDDQEELQIGSFNIKVIGLSHSIPEMNAIVIETPNLKIFHSGDWKIDDDPIVGGKFDKNKVSELSNLNIDLLVCDSTNSIVPGKSGSESKVRDSLIDIISGIEGRIFISTFASNVARLTSVAEAAAINDRQVVLSGMGMHKIARAAKKSGYFRGIPDFVDEEDAGYLPADKTLILCTGSQGEYRAALSKIARDEHRNLYADEGDTVIFSSKMIPGNEYGILRLQNTFAKRGINVITEKDSFVHVSGHPCEDELIEMFNILKPKYMIPVHGEHRHLRENANIANQCGIQAKVIENGELITISKDGFEDIKTIESGRIYKDGKILVHDFESNSSERSKLSFSGLLTVSIQIINNKVKKNPIVNTIGIPEFDEKGIRLVDLVHERLSQILKSSKVDERLENRIKNAVTKEINYIWGKKPFVEVIIHYN